MTQWCRQSGSQMESRDTSQNLGNPEIWAENFVQNVRFQDPHFSGVTALLQSGFMILAMHS